MPIDEHAAPASPPESPGARPRSEALDAILGVALPVPGITADQAGGGFVRVVDYMGSDESIVQAARVSYGRGTKRVQEDRGLIRYLLRHRHSTPFEMCELKLHLRVPMDCWRQWIRHRMANVNEYSTRYSVAIDAAQTTAPDAWRLQAAQNRQGSAGFLDAGQGARLSAREAELHRLAREVYEERLALGVAREQARKDLPLATYTEAYWKIDLHNLLHFLALRMDGHAQQEIRAYATLIGDQIVRRWCPIAWQAFLDYRAESLSLSRIEATVVRALASGRPDDALAFLRDEGLLPLAEHPAGQPLPRSRERDELEAKLGDLGLTIPWR